ncbi:DUF1631 family protein [Luteimonas deserti]|uniref:DUF1631 domain-containing protein n=1 Tax=Luteimonas deserti TaxID=2752306 RepID=A0A7Z0QQ76_9GAMM|nr:DUF1631 family protein [Luteimonas deserti]NYZ62799.1 DUF1631 domain-containing protein [Luteimonas deserti]
MSVQASASPPRSLAACGLPSRVRRTLERALAMVSEELDHPLNALLHEFEQELFRLADQARNPGVGSGHMATLRAFRVNRADLVPRFLMALESSLAAVRSPALPVARTSAQETSRAAGFGALSLVDNAVMDEDTVLREIAARQEGRANLSLHLLGQRFGVLAGAPAFDGERLPLGPQCVCRALETAAKALEIEHDARLLLYRIFDREVMAGYARVLERLDAQLADSGILPALTFVPMRVRATAVAPDEEPATTPERRRPETVPRPQSASGAQRPYTAWAPGVQAAAEPEDEDHEAAYRTLQQLMSGRRELLRKFRPGGEARARLQQLPTGDVSRALLQLQTQPLAPGKASRNLAEVRRSLLAQARQRDGEPATLAPQDEDAFELLGMLYGHIEDEIRHEAPAAALVRELQIPLLRAALQDHSFFTRRQHPARQLLNTVAESAASWHEESAFDPRVQAVLRQAVAHVVRNYEHDVGVFEEGNAQVEAQLQAQARTAELQERRHVEAARGKERLEAAKLRAGALMREILGDQRLPRFSRALLDQAWADVLTLTLLRHGETSDEFRQQLGATRRIVDAAVCPELPADPELATHVEAALGQVGYHGGEAAVIAQRLTCHRADDDDSAASRTELALKLKARTRLGEDNDRARRPALPPRTPEEQAQHEYLRTLPFGTWIEFTTNQQGDVVRRRMSWFSPITDHVLFVNQRGQRSGEQSLDAVARLMASGNARVVTQDRGHLVDRAWQAAVSALRSFAGRGEANASGAPA